MLHIKPERLKDYRLHTFRLAPGLQLKNHHEAVSFLNERSYIFFWPISQVNLPSLWTATAGDRPVADAHDDPGHITWNWKDSLLGQKAWYYAKVLRKKGTMISMQMLPNFYALSENYGSPEEDYLTIYEQGRLTLEEKLIYEALLDNGPLDTLALRKAARMNSRESDARFNRALTELQADFKIVPVGVTDSGPWHYAYVYDITTRPYPELIEQSRYISDHNARQKIAEAYLLSLGAVQLRDFTRLFHWSVPETHQALDRLEKTGLILKNVPLENQPGMFYALTDLC